MKQKNKGDNVVKIVKRDGHIVDYDPEKIRIAIGKANMEVRGKEKASKEAQEFFMDGVTILDQIIFFFLKA